MAARKVDTNVSAAASGNRLRALKALRDTLARKLDTTETDTHAQLAAQYRATLAEIAELESAGTAGNGQKGAQGSATDRWANRVARANA